ncbi:MAG: serine/threonine-protein kinase, partial [Planctomycetota bacterium]
AAVRPHGAESPQRQQLTILLLEMDVEFRFRRDGDVDVRVYQSLGSDVVAVANERIAEARGRFSSQSPLPQQSDHSPSNQAQADPHKSRCIGRYKLLEEIGAGGMGTVWMAEQQEPVQRKVALKRIRSGITDREFIARFEAERQALAMMDHPGIAKILDAGADENGAPYYVMELIQGIAISDYCDGNQLALHERIELFLPVIQAVQHAHTKGIIHRDLKPGNVLVCVRDGKPVPVVIDFGLAKAASGNLNLTEKTMFTRFGHFVGTLQYMSPEQAVLDAAAPDTRSDVYSLGAMLYELMAGSPPLQQESITNATMLEALQLVRERDPQRPSLRVSSAGQRLKAISELRKTNPSRLSQILRGDLDWIVMKALEKDRDRRYDTAAGMADDLQRYLNNEAIVARPPSAHYKLKKFVDRNRTLVAGAIAVLTLLVAGIIGTGYGLFQANASLQDAIAARADADKQTRLARDSEQQSV